MNENLVGYLLGSLDEAESRQVELFLHSHPEARTRLARLKQALKPLALDADDMAPPEGLANRTLAKLGEPTLRDLPSAPRERSTAGGRSWWRRSDVVVAVVLLLLVGGIVAPLAYRFQRDHARLACENNLRQFYVALTTYRDQQHGYPDLNRESPRNVAGLVVPMLADAGVLPDTFSVRCPAVGPHMGCALTLADLRSLSDTQFQTQAPTLSLCYAFTLGYRDDAGDVQAPWQLPGSGRPILADSPPTDGSLVNSGNHEGAGQNVLFLDGSVRFVSQRTVGDPSDDIFLNRANRVAAGLDSGDVVLGFSAARP